MLGIYLCTNRMDLSRQFLLCQWKIARSKTPQLSYASSVWSANLTCFRPLKCTNTDSRPHRSNQMGLPLDRVDAVCRLCVAVYCMQTFYEVSAFSSYRRKISLYNSIEFISCESAIRPHLRPSSWQTNGPTISRLLGKELMGPGVLCCCRQSSIGNICCYWTKPDVLK